MPQLSVRRRGPCPQHFSGGNLFPVKRKTSLPRSGLIERRPMALCRFETIHLLKCEETGPVSAGDGGVGKARLKLRHYDLPTFTFGSVNLRRRSVLA